MELWGQATRNLPCCRGALYPVVEEQANFSVLEMHPRKLGLGFLTESWLWEQNTSVHTCCGRVYFLVPMNAAAIEFRKHAMLSSRGQWGHRLRSLLAGAGVTPGTGVGVHSCVWLT